MSWLPLACLAVPSAACGEARAVILDRRPPAPAPAVTADASAPGSATAPPRDARTESGCPNGMTRIDRFCVDRYEAHLVSRGASGEVALHPYFQRPEEGVIYEARSEAGVFPQAYVSRVEARAACTNARKRLCSMREWQRACQGRRGTAYPYAERWQPKRCNMDKPHLLTLLFGADPRRWRYEQFNDPRLDQETGFLARSGEYGECAGDTGVHDLVGNLHEWVSDTVDAALLSRLAAEGPRSYQPARVGNGVFMGGFFSTHEEHGPGCKFTTVAHEPGYHDYSTGFRCCADVPPAGR